MKSKVTAIYNPSPPEHLMLDGDQHYSTNINEIIEIVSVKTGVSPTKIRQLLKKYVKNRKKHYSFYAKGDLQEYLLYEIHKRREKVIDICDNIE